MARTIGSTIGALLNVVGTTADAVSETVEMGSDLIGAAKDKVSVICEDVKHNSIADKAESKNKAIVRAIRTRMALNDERSKMQASDPTSYAEALQFVNGIFA